MLSKPTNPWARALSIPVHHIDGFLCAFCGFATSDGLIEGINHACLLQIIQSVHDEVTDGLLLVFRSQQCCKWDCEFHVIPPGPARLRCLRWEHPLTVSFS